MKKQVKYFFILAVLLNTAFNAFTQEIDTIKINITNTVYDTVQVHNNVYQFDTLYIDPFIERYEISPSYTNFWVNWRTYSGDQGQLKKQSNYTIGLELSASKSKFSLSTGFFFSKILNDFQFYDKYEMVDSSVNFDISTTSYFQIDTTGADFYVTEDSVLIDSTFIIVNDTTFIYLIDTTEITISDTVFNTVYDTTQIDTSFIKTGKIQYFEIPLIFRFRVYQGNKIELLAGVGAIFGILQFSEFYYWRQQEGDVVLVSEEVKRKIIPSIWISVKLSYYPVKNAGVFIEPHYNPRIISLFTSDAKIITIDDRFGVRFGINYTF
ncbi:MAG: hypothetical protein PHE33_08535 [Bacteroidales bacterium]|nr:hypothetical protein [Bacteroidales bacterium]